MHSTDWFHQTKERITSIFSKLPLLTILGSKSLVCVWLRTFYIFKVALVMDFELIMQSVTGIRKETTFRFVSCWLVSRFKSVTFYFKAYFAKYLKQMHSASFNFVNISRMGNLIWNMDLLSESKVWRATLAKKLHSLSHGTEWALPIQTSIEHTHKQSM